MDKDPKTKKQTEIGKVLREARERKNMTQLEVATKSGINVNYYAMIERGEVNLTVDKLNRVLNVLGLKITIP